MSLVSSDVTFVWCSYAPPNATAEDLTDHLTTTATLSYPVFILGDFNLPDINWATLTGTTSEQFLWEVAMFESNLWNPWLIHVATYYRPCTDK